MIARPALIQCWTKYTDSYEELEKWHRTVRRARWQNFVELRHTFKDADQVGMHTVFNIRQNRYRLIARVSYRRQSVFILHILTHKEYSRRKWDT